jgi:hypothetical protein
MPALRSTMIVGAIFVGYVLIANSIRCSAQQNENQINGYIILDSGKIIRGQEKPSSGYFVRGRVSEDGRFEPLAGVEGSGELCQAGHGDWLELKNGGMHSAQEGVAQHSPFVLGCVDKQHRVFKPDAKHLQPAIHY